MDAPKAATKQMISEAKQKILDAVSTYNAEPKHTTKLVFAEEAPFPHATEAIITVKYFFGDRELFFVGCRTLPCFVVEHLDSHPTKEFMDEFLETL
jgi:hypothetical protein